VNQDLKKALWAASDKLRSSMDAAKYKHIVPGLILLTYISDAFDERRAQLLAAFADVDGEFHLSEAVDHAQAPKERDCYRMANGLWVLPSARREALRAQAKQSHIRVRIDATVHRWTDDGESDGADGADVPGFCRAVTFPRLPNTAMCRRRGIMWAFQPSRMTMRQSTRRWSG